MKQICYTLLLLIAYGCSNTTTNTTVTNEAKNPATDTARVQPVNFIGDFVSDGYQERTKGTDWYAVIIDQATDTSYHIAIRSRADRKKPTCTFDANGVVKNAQQLTAIIDSITIIFTFTDSSLTISAASDQMDQLRYFCSGGASIAGTYRKLKDNLDTQTMDTRKFIKAIQFQQYNCFIETRGEGSLQELTIDMTGLTKPTKIVQPIESSVTDAVMLDMDDDNEPELLLFLQSPGSGSYGSIIAYTVTKQNKLEKVMVPSIEQDAVLGKNYMGHDRYETAKGRYLMHFFPMYKNGDANCCPTGGTKMIQYSLEQARAAKRLRIDFVRDLPQQ